MWNRVPPWLSTSTGGVVLSKPSRTASRTPGVAWVGTLVGLPTPFLNAGLKAAISSLSPAVWSGAISSSSSLQSSPFASCHFSSGKFPWPE